MPKTHARKKTGPRPARRKARAGPADRLRKGWDATLRRLASAEQDLEKQVRALLKRKGIGVKDASRTPSVTRTVDEGDEVVLGSLRARCIHNPGHTLGAVTFVVNGCAFTGDTLFGGGCGRVFEGDAAMMHASLMRLAALPPETRVYFGHEYTASNLRFAAHAEPDNQAVRKKQERVAAIRANAAADWHDATPAEMTIPSTIGEERATNPFMRSVDAAELGRRRAVKDRF